MTLWVGLLALLIAGPAWAHKPSDSYLRIRGSQSPAVESPAQTIPAAKSLRLTAEWDIALKDLEFVVGLDADGDSAITWGEVRAKRDAIAAYALSRLSLKVDGRAAHLRVTDLMIDDHTDGAYAVLFMTTDQPAAAALIEVEYRLLFDVDPTHRGLVRFGDEKASSTHVLSPQQPTVMLRAGELSRWKALLDFIREGVWHIWIGFDHILFLLTLLLPAMLIRRDNRWRAAPSFRSAMRTILTLVTMFTLAHSITLWLAVTQIVTVPGRWVEAAIALSIIVTAASNLLPRLHLSGWMIAFFFGLIHGFGFANVLADLGLSSSTLAVALVGFNVGVELGQFVIVVVFFPIGFMLRDTAFYRIVFLQLGSVVIALIAGLWMVERVFNLQYMPF